MTVRRPLPHVLALALGVGVALLVACGGGTKGGIPAASAGELKSQIADVQQAVDDGRCDDVSGQLRQVEDSIDALPSTVDKRLRQSLRDASDRLHESALSECEVRTETTQTETTTQPTTQTTTTQPTTTEPAPAQAKIVRVRAVGGVPKGGIVRMTVKKGDRVAIVVTSDVADHVHLHGYDIMRDVTAGGTARIRFRATLPGRFEVELEDRGVQIADLTVEP